MRPREAILAVWIALGILDLSEGHAYWAFWCALMAGANLGYGFPRSEDERR